MILGYLLEQVYSALGFVKLQSIATGGSATTIVDTSLATRFGTNAFKKHLFFISKTTDGAAPQGQFGILPTAHYVASTWTFTIPTVTAAVGAGDIYTIMKPTIELYEMLSQINIGMALLPPVRLSDTSLTGTVNTLEYTLPVATKGYPIQEIWIGNATDGYKQNTDYRVRPATGGSTETLVFGSQPGYDSTTASNETINIIYLGKQTTLSTYSDTISEKYPDELVISACVYTALRYYMIKKGLMINRRWTPILQEYEKRYNRATVEHPVRTLPASQPKTINFGRMA